MKKFPNYVYNFSEDAGAPADDEYNDCCDYDDECCQSENTGSSPVSFADPAFEAQNQALTFQQMRQSAIINEYANCIQLISMPFGLPEGTPENVKRVAMQMALAYMRQINPQFANMLEKPGMLV